MSERGWFWTGFVWGIAIAIIFLGPLLTAIHFYG